MRLQKRKNGDTGRASRSRHMCASNASIHTRHISDKIEHIGPCYGGEISVIHKHGSAKVRIGRTCLDFKDQISCLSSHDGAWFMLLATKMME